MRRLALSERRRARTPSACRSAAARTDSGVTASCRFAPSIHERVSVVGGHRAVGQRPAMEHQEVRAARPV